MHTNVVIQISQELKRMFKIEARFLSLLKALLETSFSKTSYHTETYNRFPIQISHYFPICEVLLIYKKFITLISNKIKHQFCFRDLELA